MRRSWRSRSGRLGRERSGECFRIAAAGSTDDTLGSTFLMTAVPALSGGRLCGVWSTGRKGRHFCRKHAIALAGPRAGNRSWRILAMDFAERAARNEEIFRDVNKQIEEGAAQHGVSGHLPFHCECGGGACVETIEIPPGRYAAIVQERYHFVVIPGHEQSRIERIVETEGHFLVVEKIGEAREQIDEDHPQGHHHG
jgi:hypothetical protein